MKTILKFTTVVAIMLSTVVGMAKEPKLNLVASSEAKSLILTLEHVSEETYVRIIDNDNQVIYSKQVNAGNFNKKFNFKQLADGIYYFVTEDSSRSYIYTLSIVGDHVTIGDLVEDFKPHFRTDKGKIFINYLNSDLSPVVIKIYDEEDRLLFNEAITDTFVVEKAFNFTSAHEGTYRVIVTDGETYYSNNIVVN